jgi:hypothetical protein
MKRHSCNDMTLRYSGKFKQSSWALTRLEMMNRPKPSDIPLVGALEKFSVLSDAYRTRPLLGGERANLTVSQIFQQRARERTMKACQREIVGKRAAIDCGYDYTHGYRGRYLSG